MDIKHKRRCHYFILHKILWRLLLYHHNSYYYHYSTITTFIPISYESFRVFRCVDQHHVCACHSGSRTWGRDPTASRSGTLCLRSCSRRNWISEPAVSRSCSAKANS